MPQVGQVCRGLAACPRTVTMCPARVVSTRVCRAKTSLPAGFVGMAVRSYWHCLVGPAPSGRAYGDGADPAEVGVALVPERSPARGAPRDEERFVTDAAGDDEEPPRTLPGTVIGEARRADLAAGGGCPAAGGAAGEGM